MRQTTKTNMAILLIFLATSLGLVIGANLNQESLTGAGRVSSVNVDVFSDPACTQKLTMVNWTYVDPNATASYPFYIKNVGSKTLTLSMTSDATTLYPWLTQRWDVPVGTQIVKNEVIAANLLLDVGNAPENEPFNYVIIITGTA